MPVPLINVSNRLPVTLADDGSIKKSSGGLVTALEGLATDQYDLTWLGWPGKDVPADKRDAVSKILQAEHGCTPVFLPQELADAHYEGLANSSIWPLLHYLPSFYQYQAGWWDAYVEVNRTFAERILEMADDGALVWVHDYQLMLLPRLLKAANPTLRVGFFLHTPFPSSEVFRYHPNREDLLEGMLGADVAGFHTFGYLRHFRSAALNILGVASEMTDIHRGGSVTRLGVYPIGIHAPKFEHEFTTPAFAEKCADFARDFAGKQVVLSVERLDYTKGLLRRLDAIELFLERADKGRRDAIKFMFIAVPSRQGVEEYRELREEVEYRVGRINGQYATLHNSPIHLIHGSVGFTELCALYALADVALVTPLRDGMNLVAKEYVVCQRDLPDGAACPPGHKPTPGALVLSEFAGAAEELFSALMVNPYDTPAVADAIAEALAMPEPERRRRMQAMRHRVTSYDARAWASDFLGDLAAVRVTDRTAAEAAAPTPAADLAGARARIGAAVAGGRPVAMFLDYDGTLREIVRDPAAAAPTPEMRRLLDRLATTANVDVTIISGRTPDDLESFLGAYDMFGLVAEHGAAIRPPRARAWETLDQNLDFGWKEQVARILGHYERSTPGTHVEEKRTSLVWHYRRTDNEYGEWKARQLVDDLSAVAANVPVVIRQGRKIVEVTSSQINKGAAVANLLAGRHYDVVLIAGDDTTDESMFRLAPDGHERFTVRVGDGDTAAALRLPTPVAFRQFLTDALDGR